MTTQTETNIEPDRSIANSPGGVVVVDSSMAHVAGAMVWWRRCEAAADYDELCEVWEDTGLDEKLLLSKTSPEHALKMTVRDEANRRRLVRPLERGTGYAIVNETAKGDDLAYDIKLTVKVVDKDTLDVQPPSHPRAGTLTAEWQRNKGRVSPTKMTAWLVKLITACDSTSLRDTGGIYFVPRTRLDDWRTMADVVREVSGYSIFEVPALRSGEAVEAILDAVTREAEAEVEAITADLDECVNGDGEYGKRRLRTRETRCTAMIEKVTRYESLLDANRETMRTKLSKLRARATAMILTLDTDDDGDGS